MHSRTQMNHFQISNLFIHLNLLEVKEYKRLDYTNIIVP